MSHRSGGDRRAQSYMHNAAMTQAGSVFETNLDLMREDLRREGYDDTNLNDFQMQDIADEMGEVEFLCTAWNRAVRLLCEEHRVPTLRKDPV